MKKREHTAVFRFYEELNDFLPDPRKKRDIHYAFNNSPAIKDPIEAIGIPHTEVELVVVNGTSVGFDYRLRDGDRVAVFPVFESFDITPILKVREKPLRETRFICDVHLGKLVRYLRMLGFDTLYRNDYADEEIVRLAAGERRIVLTRDRRLLHHRAITHGYWVRSQDPDAQMREVLQRFDLDATAGLFSRCPACNGLVEAVPKSEILERLAPLTRRYYNTFHRCRSCGRIYWRGSHYDQLEQRIQEWIPPLPR